jgi:hypothetical protein
MNTTAAYDEDATFARPGNLVEWMSSRRAIVPSASFSNNFEQRLAARLARIWKLIDSTTSDDLRELYLELHGLAGTAGTSGNGRISELASQGEKWCGEALRNDRMPPYELRFVIEALQTELVALKEERRQAA